jgi:hypothetical protein
MNPKRLQSMARCVFEAMHFFLLLFMNGYLIAQIKHTKQKFQKGLRFGLKRRRMNRGMVLHKFLQRLPLSRLVGDGGGPIPPSRRSDYRNRQSNQEHSFPCIKEVSGFTIPTEFVQPTPTVPVLSTIDEQTSLSKEDAIVIQTETMMDPSSDSHHAITNLSALHEEVSVGAESSTVPLINQEDPIRSNSCLFAPKAPQPLHSLLSIDDSFDIDLADVSLFLENDLSLFQSNSR